jgi:hypothetical protein
MLSKSWDDDDVAITFLLLPSRIPLLASVISQTKVRDFMTRLRDGRIPRCALVDTRQSSFQQLYCYRNGQAFITFTGLDYFLPVFADQVYAIVQSIFPLF